MIHFSPLQKRDKFSFFLKKIVKQPLRACAKSKDSPSPLNPLPHTHFELIAHPSDAPWRPLATGVDRSSPTRWLEPGSSPHFLGWVGRATKRQRGFWSLLFNALWGNQVSFTPATEPIDPARQPATRRNSRSVSHSATQPFSQPVSQFPREKGQSVMWPIYSSEEKISLERCPNHYNLLSSWVSKIKKCFCFLSFCLFFFFLLSAIRAKQVSGKNFPIN